MEGDAPKGTTDGKWEQVPFKFKSSPFRFYEPLMIFLFQAQAPAQFAPNQQQQQQRHPQQQQPVASSSRASAPPNNSSTVVQQILQVLYI